MSEADEIIVFDSYETVIQANLVKTKLDARGVPNFLTEENFNSWYPFRNELFSGVRLHIFASDLSTAREILADVVEIPESEKTRCPHCRSANVQLEPTRKNKLLYLLFAFFFFIAPGRRLVYRCQDCETEFD